MAPPTLVSMAQRNLIRNLAHLQDVGDAPYNVIKPALRKIVDPQQLRTIEIASPHIGDADAELWIAFVKRDIPNWKDKMVEPKNPRSWWKVYRKLYKEEQAAQEEQQKQLKEALMKEKAEKEGHQTNILGTVVHQRFKQKAFLDGNVNTKAGSIGIERVGSVANAKKNGKNIISAIRKASTKPSPFRASLNAAADNADRKMWKTPVPQPGVRRKETPNLLYRGPPSAAQAAVDSAVDRAIKQDEKIKGKARRSSKSPSPPASGIAHSPPKTVPSASTPSRTASPAMTAKPATPLGPGAGTKRPSSPEKASPAPTPQKRQRAPVSIFMPKRARR